MDIVDKMNETPDWHQTKGLFVAIIVLLLTNIGSSIWWAADLNNDVQDLKEEPNLLERVLKLEAITEANAKYLNRLNSTLDRVNANMTRIDREQVKRTETIERAKRYLGNK